jgi:hypothetical protein
MLRLNLIKPKALQAVNFTRADLVRIGAKAVDTIQKRCARGVNVRDRAAKPLSSRYLQKKTRIGQPPIRNLMYSGSMLGALTVVSADQNRVIVGFTRQAELVKASKNQDRDPWFGLSKNDEGIVLNYAGQILNQRANS